MGRYAHGAKGMRGDDDSIFYQVPRSLLLTPRWCCTMERITLRYSLLGNALGHDGTLSDPSRRPRRSNVDLSRLAAPGHIPRCRGDVATIEVWTTNHGGFSLHLYAGVPSSNFTSPHRTACQPGTHPSLAGPKVRLDIDLTLTRWPLVRLGVQVSGTVFTFSP